MNKPRKVTDPELLRRLNAEEPTAQQVEQQTKVTDPVLLARLNSDEGDPEASPEYGDYAAGLAQQGLVGATAGWSDEIQARIAALYADANQPKSILAPPAPTFEQQLEKNKGAKFALPGGGESDNYRLALEQIRADNDRFSKENPYASLAANVVGGVSTGGLLKSVGIPTAGIKGAAATGTAAGAIAGSGTAKEGEKIVGGLKGAGIGLGAGLTLAGIGAGAVAAYRSWKPDAQALFKKLAETSGLSATQIETRLNALGPKAALADVSQAFRDAADVTVSRLGASSRRIQEFIRRDEQQLGRILQPIKRYLGSTEQGVKTAGQLKEIRATVGNDLYEQAYGIGMRMPSAKLDMWLTKNPAVQKAWAAAQRMGKSDPDLDPSLLFDGLDNAKPSLRGWQQITEELWAAADKYTRGASPNLKHAARLKRLRKVILDELDDATVNPNNGRSLYAEARALWSTTKRADEMLETGQQFFKTNPDDIIDVMKTMSDADKVFYRFGVGRAVEDKLSKIADTSDVTRMLRNAEFRRKVYAVFPEKEAAVDFINTVRAESIKKATTNAVGRGSQTHVRKVIEKQLGGADFAPSDYTTKTQAAMSATKKIASMLSKGPTEKTMQELGDYLTAMNPEDQRRAISIILQGVERPMMEGGKYSAGLSNVLAQKLAQ